MQWQFQKKVGKFSRRNHRFFPGVFHEYVAMFTSVYLQYVTCVLPSTCAYRCHQNDNRRLKNLPSLGFLYKKLQLKASLCMIDLKFLADRMGPKTILKEFFCSFQEMQLIMCLN
ncbi:hypothetical protein CW304_12490 [Bacillus sp. UFRGS-B20]|nr:hypothetical protein CW304_12490 [Bacillus sp. UFRGS-B20]